VNVLVDTSVWSLAFRRKRDVLSVSETAIVAELGELIAEGRARILGVVRQESLSGIREATQFEKIRGALRAFEDEALSEEDYERAARCGNRCRSRGIAVSTTDMLLCAVAESREYAIFSTDPDLNNYGAAIPVKLHAMRKTSR
jgi:predicted nucleic acid-binding protein